MTILATLLTSTGILVLLFLNRDPKVRTSPTLWLPVIWFAIAFSRPVSAWLGMSPERSTEVYLEGSPLDRNVFALLLALGLGVLVMRRRKISSVLRSNLPLLVYFSYCLLSVSWSEFPDVAFKRWIKAVGDIVMIMIVVTEPNATAAMQRLFARTAFAFAPLSLLYIRYFGELGRTYSRWEGTISYTGIAADKNMLGVGCLVFGLALFWRIREEFGGRGFPGESFHSRRRHSIVAHGIILFMVILLLVISNSMTALGCFVLASGLMIVVSVPGLARRRGLIHLMVVGIVLAVFLTLIVNIGGGVLLQTLGRNTTLTGRTEIWPVVLENSGNPLFGVGFESFWLGPRLERIWLQWPGLNQAHNGYLETYLTLGWVGLGLLAVVALNGYLNILRNLRHNPVDGKLQLAYFVTALAYNFTEAAFKSLHPMWLAFLLAVTVAPRRAVKGEPGHIRQRRLIERSDVLGRSYGRSSRLRAPPNTEPSRQ